MLLPLSNESKKFVAAKVTHVVCKKAEISISAIYFVMEVCLTCSWSTLEAMLS